MHPNPYTSNYNLAATKELLFVGFEDGFDFNIRSFPYNSASYTYSVENNGFRAFQWLQNRVGEIATYQPPYAVFCRLEWLMDNNYRLAIQMAADPDLCFVPLIAFADKGKPANKTALATHGVDDCYTVPVEWSALENRLEFLNQFKPKVMEQSGRMKSEQFGFEVPVDKRAFDVAGALCGIVLTAWIWLPVMLAIWLESRGPVIYKSKRVGSGYRVFDFFKFRSMYHDADQHLQQFHHLNQYENGKNGHPVFIKIAHDPRVTRVGRFIRKYSIDELPQLINILRGEMSLVGNRPLPLYEAETLTRDEWSARFLAPAGLTGLWQITKRGHADMTAEERIQLDIAYSQNGYSVLTDLNIVLKTFRALVQKEDV